MSVRLRVHDLENADFTGLIAQQGQPEAFGGEIERLAQRRDLVARDFRLAMEGADVGLQLPLRERQLRLRGAAREGAPDAACSAPRPSSTAARSAEPVRPSRAGGVLPDRRSRIGWR